MYFADPPSISTRPEDPLCDEDDRVGIVLDRIAAAVADVDVDDVSLAFVSFIMNGSKLVMALSMSSGREGRGGGVHVDRDCEEVMVVVLDEDNDDENGKA